MSQVRIGEVAISTNKEVFLDQVKVLNKEFIQKPKGTIERMYQHLVEQGGREMVIVFSEHNQHRSNVSLPFGKVDWELYLVQTVEMKIVVLSDAVLLCREVRNNKRERQFNGYMPRYQ